LFDAYSAVFKYNNIVYKPKEKEILIEELFEDERVQMLAMSALEDA
jgi:hypothetical protein